MAGRILPGNLRRLRLAATDVAGLQDALQQWRTELASQLQNAEPGLTPTGLKQASYQASVGELVRYDGSKGITVTAPASPQKGDRFGVKNVTTSTATCYVSSGPFALEDPGTGFTVVSQGRITVTLAGFAAEWRFDGSTWLVTSTKGAPGGTGVAGAAGPNIVNVVPNRPFMSGSVETVIGSIYVTGSTFSSVHAMLGASLSTDACTLRLRQFAGASGQGNIILTLTGSGLLADVPSTGSVTFPATGFYDATLFCSSISGSSICGGVRFLA